METAATIIGLLIVAFALYGFIRSIWRAHRSRGDWTSADSGLFSPGGDGHSAGDVGHSGGDSGGGH